MGAAVLALDLSRPWRVEIKEYKPARTNDQLAYWFGVIVATLADFTGADKEEMHEFLCGSYFGWIEYEIFGKRKQRPVRTLTSPDMLDRKAMSEMFDWAIAFAAKQNILIEYPNE